MRSSEPTFEEPRAGPVPVLYVRCQRPHAYDHDQLQSTSTGSRGSPPSSAEPEEPPRTLLDNRGSVWELVDRFRRESDGCVVFACDVGRQYRLWISEQPAPPGRAGDAVELLVAGLRASAPGLAARACAPQPLLRFDPNSPYRTERHLGLAVDSLALRFCPNGLSDPPFGFRCCSAGRGLGSGREAGFEGPSFELRVTYPATRAAVYGVPLAAAVHSRPKKKGPRDPPEGGGLPAGASPHASPEPPSPACPPPAPAPAPAPARVPFRPKRRRLVASDAECDACGETMGDDDACSLADPFSILSIGASTSDAVSRGSPGEPRAQAPAGTPHQWIDDSVVKSLETMFVVSQQASRLASGRPRGLFAEADGLVQRVRAVFAGAGTETEGPLPPDKIVPLHGDPAEAVRQIEELLCATPLRSLSGTEEPGGAGGAGDETYGFVPPDEEEPSPPGAHAYAGEEERTAADARLEGLVAGTVAGSAQAADFLLHALGSEPVLDSYLFRTPAA
eukprot:tig00020996_g16946.t1